MEIAVFPDSKTSAAMTAPMKICLVTVLMIANIAVMDGRSFNINGTKVHPVCRIRNYCKNGGSCYSVGKLAHSWTCNCVGDWSGVRCDVKRGCYNPSICQNGGSCIGVVSRAPYSWYCQCRDGWYGASGCNYKEICLHRGLCQNGGACTDAGRSGRMWKCVCPDGWYGKRCESRTPVTKALFINSLCNNGGTPSVNNTCVCPERWSGPQCSDFIGTERTDFIALLLIHYGHNNPPYLLLTSNMSTAVHVLKRGERREYMQGLTLESSLQVKPPLSFKARQIEYKAVRICSTQPISVTLSDENIFRSRDLTTIFPTEKLSTTYLISTADPNLLSTSVNTKKWEVGSLKSHFKIFVLSQVVIVALHVNTSVCITLPPHLRQDPYDYIGKIRGQTTVDNTTFEIKLDPLEPFQIFHFLDFSGTRIHSSKPIAVFSGILCKTSFDCNHVIEQMPPVDQLDVTFIVPPNFYKTMSLIRVISDENTTITVKSSTKSGNVSLSAGVPHDIEFDEEVLAIQSISQCGDHQCKKAAPLLVNILSFGDDYLYTNRMHMTLVPGIHQYQRYYKIVVPTGWSENYLILIIQKDAADSLLMNGERLNIWGDEITVEEVVYEVMLVVVNPGVVTLKSEDAAFGLIAYGYSGDKEAYAFAGNLLLH